MCAILLFIVFSFACWGPLKVAEEGRLFFTEYQCCAHLSLTPLLYLVLVQQPLVHDVVEVHEKVCVW